MILIVKSAKIVFRAIKTKRQLKLSLMKLRGKLKDFKVNYSLWKQQDLTPLRSFKV